MTHKRLVFLLSLLLSTAALAEVRLPKIFTSQMVIQQQLPIRIWGAADPGEDVKVEFNGKSAAAKADRSGRWRVDLPAMTADGKEHTLTVKGKNTITLDKVVLGEVWLAVGQSNMSRGLRFVKDRAKAEEMNFPNLRLFYVGLDQVPQREEPALTRGWAPATHESMNSVFSNEKVGPYEFSEVTYYFGKAIHQSLRVPVGMISSAFPGSIASQWTAADKPDERFDFASGKPDKGPGSFYQSMIHGLPPFAIRGAIYYQGENDASNKNYGEELKRMLETWRAKFERPDMPFYMTQLGQTTFNGGTLHVTTVQQWMMANVPYTGVAASNDLIDGANPKKAKERVDKDTGFPVIGGGDPHPPNKHFVAARLARIALGETYKKLDGESFGPMVASYEVAGDKVRVKFKYVGKGLKTDDGEPPNWFQIAGEDMQFKKAEAKIVAPDTVELRAEGVPAPKHYRFAWNHLARHNLYNSDGLPALANRSEESVTK